jgi:peptide/nickel transport system ATP-binding protein
MSDGDLLRINDLKVTFDLESGPLQAVRGVSMRVPRGRTVALVGESGSGKSVIAQSILGILPKIGRIESGSMLFDRDGGGEIIDIAKLDRDGAQMRKLRGGSISIIFQEPMSSLSPVHTIGDQIAEALHLHRDIGRAEGRELVAEMLRLTGFADPKRALKTFPFELSGGLRQRAMIAMALVARPTLLIADEPTTALDVTIQAQILKLMRDLQRDLKMAMLLITHDLGIVANMADEIVVLYHGEVMEAGTTAELFAKAQHPYLQALFRAVPRFDMKPGERLTPLREIVPGEGSLFGAGPATGEASASQAHAGDVILIAEKIGKQFQGRVSGFLGGPKSALAAVDDVSFELRKGECLGLVGESGCGKTTLSKMVMRALTPSAGRILIHNGDQMADTANLAGDALTAFRRRIQFVFQDPFGSLNPRMTVFDIITEPLVIHGIGDRDSREAMAKELMALVGLDMRHLRRYPHSFSGGQRQRIGIARALALRPEIVICDEPVSALDVSIQAQILNLLKDLQQRLGLTYIFISHNLAVVDYIADRIMVMCAGRLVEIAPKARLFSRPAHPYTKALIAAVPDPSLSHLLDFSRLMEDRASVPSQWPAPFTIDADNRPGLVEMDSGHWVRAGIDARRVA